MKRILILFLGFVIMLQIFSGCASNKDVEFEAFYSDIMSFNENDENNEESKPIQQDAILMLNNDEYEQFKDKHFTPREIPME